MPRQERRSHELRCFCARKPLLATYGVDEKGRLYVHVKVWKQSRIFGEILITEVGNVSLRCRECLRWQVVKIRQPGKAYLEVQEDPVIPTDESSSSPLLVDPTASS